MTAIETDLIREFREFEAERGPSFIWGHINSPYAGCSHLNACALVRGDFAFVTADLNRFKGEHQGIDYARYVVPAPDDLASQECAVGCIRLTDLEEVLSPASSQEGYEFHPLTELAPNVPHKIVRQALEMCQDLGYGAIVEGKFRCASCETDLLYAESIEYLESEFRGNGGIGIEVGAPVCGECYSLHHCPYCGEEVAPEAQAIDAKGHCIYCASRNIPCSICGENIDLSWGANADDLEGYRHGACGECAALMRRGEEENERYKAISGATGTLFPTT